MAETFSLSELVIPGTYIRVRAEGLIRAGGISTGNIGIVGTARKRTVEIDEDGNVVTDADGNIVFATDEGGAPVLEDIYGQTFILSDYASALDQLDTYDAYNGGSGTLNLTRALEILFRNGARTVFARALDPAESPGTPQFEAEFAELVKENVNILVVPGLTTANASAVLGPVLESAENTGRDMIAVIGSDVDASTTSAVNDVLGQVVNNDRMILATPGMRSIDAAAGSPGSPPPDVTLNGRYTAAAVAGLLSTLTPQTSPTNKVLPGVTKLAHRFAYGQMKQLVAGQVLVLEDRRGIRVVRGLTMDNGAFKQITTRRIVDFAKAGIRQVSDPFIGRLNNQRVRAALQGAIDGFLTTMVQDEALTGYTLQVTATRDDEIAGRAMVNAVLQPTFSIDFIAVTLVLQ